MRGAVSPAAPLPQFGNDDRLFGFWSEEEIGPMGSKMAYGIAIGIAIGAGIGVSLDNLLMGIGIGIAIGAALGGAWTAWESDQGKNGSPKQ